MKVLVVFGTRPEAIKMAPVIHALRAAPGIESRVCVTSQHRELLAPVLDLFGIVPDHDLGLMRHGQDLADITSGTLLGLRDVLARDPCDLLLVHGDTATTLGASLAAFYRHVPVAHVEAGLRTGNLRAPWPEEMNRSLVGRLAGLHFAPTLGARRNLLDEGVPEERVHVTGNTVVDALQQAVARLEGDAALSEGLRHRFGFLDPRRRLLLVTGHRRENLGAGLERVCMALRQLGRRADSQIVYALHPNPAVRDPVRRLLGGAPNTHLIEPQDYLPFVYLLSRAHLVLTDSGGIQEEAPALGKPVLVTRETTERPEAVAAGAARLVGTDADRIVAEAGALLDDEAAYGRMARTALPFGDGRAAERIVEVLRRT